MTRLGIPKLIATLCALTVASFAHTSVADSTAFTLQSADITDGKPLGFEISVESLQAKYKLSQNRSAADQHHVMQALEASSGENERGVAALMAKRKGE